MFYESDRIITKNKKYVKSKAYIAYESARNTGMSNEEIAAASIDAVTNSKDMLNETQIDIISITHEIALSNMEKIDEKNTAEFTNDNNGELFQ